MKGFTELVAEAKTRIRETNPREVRQKQENSESFYLVDVREDNEWEKGHLPGAIHLGKGIIERDIAQRIPSTQMEVVLYCGGGSRSALAADALREMGYTNVASMAGGYREWLNTGYPIEGGGS